MKNPIPISRRLAAAAFLGWSLIPALAVPAGASQLSDGQPAADQSAEDQLSGDQISHSTSAEDPISTDQLALRMDLLRLQIRYGEDFVFPMEIPSGESGEAQDDSLSFLMNLREAPLGAVTLPGCPLPQGSHSRSIQDLERQLQAMTESYSGQWSVYVKNLTTDDSILINDVPMKSASVMKLFVLGTVYEAIGEQQLERTQEVVDLITTMICDSSNEATNRLLAMLGDGSYAAGIDQVNEYISSHGYSSMTHEYNGFNDSSTFVDPSHNNQISAADCGLLLERVYRRTFGSWRVCNEVEDLMLNQNTRYKIPGGLPEGALVGNKTGEMSTVENDVAIIYGDRSDYILCVLSQDWDSGDSAISHIQEISALVYVFFDDPAYYEDQEPDLFDQLASLAARFRELEESEAEGESQTEETLETEAETESQLIDMEAAFPLLNSDTYAQSEEERSTEEPLTEEQSVEPETEITDSDRRTRHEDLG